MFDGTTNDSSFSTDAGDPGEPAQWIVQGGSTTNVPYLYPSGHSLGGSPILTGYSKTAMAPKICRACGESNDIPTILLGGAKLPDLCPKCSEKVFEKLVREMIPNAPEFCQECFSHLNACKCPKSEDLRQLRK